jgi:hypothetical protein
MYRIHQEKNGLLKTQRRFYIVKRFLYFFWIPVDTSAEGGFFHYEYEAEEELNKIKNAL